MLGNEIYQFARELFPINRSITGDGVRKTLQKISEHLPKLQVKSVPTGTKVFDWTVPKEWSVNEAYIITPKLNYLFIQFFCFICAFFPTIVI